MTTDNAIVTDEYERQEAICTETAMSQWERSLKRPDLTEKDRVRGAIEAYKRQVFAFNMLPSALSHTNQKTEGTEGEDVDPPASETQARGSAEAVVDPYAWLFHDPPPAPVQHVRGDE